MNKTTPAKSLTRFIASGSRTSGDRLVRPLAPILFALVRETPAGQRHSDLGARYSELRTKLTALSVEAEKAKAADLDAERKAVEVGRKAPRPKLPAIEAEIEETRRALAVLEEQSLPESTHDLFATAFAVVAEADAEASSALARKIEEVRDALHAAEARLLEAGELGAEVAWIRELRNERVQAVWRSGQRVSVAPKALEYLRQAVGAFPLDLARGQENREKAARDREHSQQQKLPPGTTIFRAGKEFVVREDGTEEEVPR